MAERNKSKENKENKKYILWKLEMNPRYFSLAWTWPIRITGISRYGKDKIKYGRNILEGWLVKQAGLFIIYTALLSRFAWNSSDIQNITTYIFIFRTVTTHTEQTTLYINLLVPGKWGKGVIIIRWKNRNKIFHNITFSTINS